MKEIKLTKGFVALVDDDDYEYINQWKWGVSKSQRGVRYACRSVNNKVRKYIIMHRLIMKPLSNMSIDHINHNGLDNRKCNLRIVTHRENMQNIKRKTITGLTGVSINCKNKFRATIYKNHKQVHLGYFNTPEEAHRAYVIAFRELPKPYQEGLQSFGSLNGCHNCKHQDNDDVCKKCDDTWDKWEGGER